MDGLHSSIQHSNPDLPADFPSEALDFAIRIHRRAERILGVQNLMVNLSEGLKKVGPLIGSQESMPDKERILVATSDFLRVGLVLGIASLDYYFSHKYVEIFFVRLNAGQLTEGMCKILEKAGFDTKMALSSILASDRISPLKDAMSAYFEKVTTNKLSFIDDLFETVCVKNLSQNACSLFSAPDLLLIIDQAVKRRNQIAHRADLDSKLELSPIEFTSVDRQLACVLTFIIGAEYIINRAHHLPHAMVQDLIYKRSDSEKLVEGFPSPGEPESPA